MKLNILAIIIKAAVIDIFNLITRHPWGMASLAVILRWTKITAKLGLGRIDYCFVPGG